MCFCLQIQMIFFEAKKHQTPKFLGAMSDGSRELEENENSLALATDCAKLWPKMLSKGLQDEYPPQGDKFVVHWEYPMVS